MATVLGSGCLSHWDPPCNSHGVNHTIPQRKPYDSDGVNDPFPMMWTMSFQPCEVCNTYHINHAMSMMWTIQFQNISWKFSLMWVMQLSWHEQAILMVWIYNFWGISCAFIMVWTMYSILYPRCIHLSTTSHRLFLLGSERSPMT